MVGGVTVGVTVVDGASVGVVVGVIWAEVLHPIERNIIINRRIPGFMNFFISL